MKLHPIADWVDWISPKAAGAPDVTIRAAVVATLEEFCRGGLSVLHDFPGSIAATEAKPTYDIPTMDGLTVAELTKAYFDGSPLRPRGEPELDEIFGRGWESLTAQAPSHYFQPSLSEVRIVPALAAGCSGLITGRCAWAISRQTDSAPIVLFEQYRDGIVDGVLARLFGQANTPWYAPAMVDAKERRFKDGIGLAKKNTLQGNVRKPQFAQIRSTFR
jgi:hypothetical protein